MRAQDVLADGVDEAEFGGMSVRKGSIAAFLASAGVLQDPHSNEQERERALADIAELTPALRAVGLFDVLAIRDQKLREFVEGQP